MPLILLSVICWSDIHTNNHPACTWRQNDIVLTLIRRWRRCDASRRIDVCVGSTSIRQHDAMHRIDVKTTLFWRCVPAGGGHSRRRTAWRSVSTSTHFPYDHAYYFKIGGRFVVMLAHWRILVRCFKVWKTFLFIYLFKISWHSVYIHT